ncbi:MULTISPECIES: hypothetical protein [Bacillus cereus group]|uniref:hypothetical protein n=1 Tax=Bacillus cereus group TaxID=86661 RepID=UPI0022E1A02B|nr:hypothetical protein [Bacillus cereus group sp. BcHK124]MDA1946720.1 hypothetical protein [Bacillus cereus group sp. BcHK124]
MEKWFESCRENVWVYNSYARGRIPFKQAVRNVSRFIGNPKKHFKRLPGARLERLAKAKKNSTKAKLMRISNAIGKRK